MKKDTQNQPSKFTTEQLLAIREAEISAVAERLAAMENAYNEERAYRGERGVIPLKVDGLGFWVYRVKNCRAKGYRAKIENEKDKDGEKAFIDKTSEGENAYKSVYN